MTTEDKKTVCSIFSDLLKAEQEIFSIEQGIEGFDWRRTQETYRELVGKMFDFPNLDYRGTLETIDYTDEDDEQYGISRLLSMFTSAHLNLVDKLISVINAPHRKTSTTRKMNGIT